MNVINGKQVIESLDLRHFTIAFARGGLSGERTRANSGIDGM
jgi:hypothetical protein